MSLRKVLVTTFVLMMTAQSYAESPFKNKYAAIGAGAVVTTGGVAGVLLSARAYDSFIFENSYDISKSISYNNEIKVLLQHHKELRRIKSLIEGFNEADIRALKNGTKVVENYINLEVTSKQGMLKQVDKALLSSRSSFVSFFEKQRYMYGADPSINIHKQSVRDAVFNKDIDLKKIKGVADEDWDFFIKELTLKGQRDARALAPKIATGKAINAAKYISIGLGIYGVAILIFHDDVLPTSVLSEATTSEVLSAVAENSTDEFENFVTVLAQVMEQAEVVLEQNPAG